MRTHSPYYNRLHDTEALQTISPLVSRLPVRFLQRGGGGGAGDNGLEGDGKRRGRSDFLHTASIISAAALCPGSSNWYRQQLFSVSIFFFDHQSQPNCTPQGYQQQPGRTFPLRSMSPSSMGPLLWALKTASGAPFSEVRGPASRSTFLELRRATTARHHPLFRGLNWAPAFPGPPPNF